MVINYRILKHTDDLSPQLAELPNLTYFFALASVTARQSLCFAKSAYRSFRTR